MALNKIERKLLKQVRRMLRRGETAYICRGLATASYEMRLGEACSKLQKCEQISIATRRLDNYVMECLDGSHALGGWQRANGHGERSDEQRRQDRIAWITWMLDQPKEK
jgi:hypothetical protein